MKRGVNEPDFDANAMNIIVQNFLSRVDENKEVANASLVCKQWLEIIDNDRRLMMMRIGFYGTRFFGTEHWEKYFGHEEKDIPPLPEAKKLKDFLLKEHPKMAGKKIHETHLLTLIPKEVYGQQLTLDSVKELVNNPKNGGHKKWYEKKYEFDLESPKDHVLKTCWVLMTQGAYFADIHSAKNCLAKRIDWLNEDRQVHDDPYVQSELFEVIMSLLLHQVLTKKRVLKESTHLPVVKKSGIKGVIVVVEKIHGGVTIYWEQSRL